MRYFWVILLGLSLFLLTCALCWAASYLVMFSPLFSIIFLLLGTLGVVLAVDVMQAILFP